jgi:hypothetical protein
MLPQPLRRLRAHAGPVDVPGLVARNRKDVPLDIAAYDEALELRRVPPEEVFAVPGRQRTAATTTTPSKQEETGKKPSPNGRRKGNGSSAPEMRTP